MEIVKLCPAYKNYLWGGRRLIDQYGKPDVCDPMAESWELSLHPDGQTTLPDGRTLAQVLTEKELGSNCGAFPFFPMLIKLIDAKQNLSVQVHPSDAYALAHENSFGKTEMWYIVDAEAGAGIYLGFNRDVTREEYQNAIQNNTLTELLNFYPVKAGECYFIPSGTIHAIGEGCLICEIQQNSNLTYRVYDYGRRDKNGNTRELHVEKALLVTSLEKFENSALSIPVGEDTILGLSKYFRTVLLSVKGKRSIVADTASFRTLICIKGEGRIGNLAVKKGESVFIPAGYGEVFVEGEMTLIQADVRKYYVGIDLGGTFIKGGLVDDLGNILISDKVPTESEGGSERVSSNIAALVKALISRAGMTEADIEGIGIGVPGTIDSAKGNVIYSNNLGWKDFAIADRVKELTGLTVKIANDANVAMLGEFRFGAARGHQNAVMLTLGTGVGGGIIANGQLCEGNQSAGAELGHMAITMGGERCTCGRYGCLEAYASATALIRDTKRAMEQNPASKMWVCGSLDAVDGKTAFACKDEDETAARVVNDYLTYLANGIISIANLLRPEVVLLGGGICAEGDALVKPLQKMLDDGIFGGNLGPRVTIRIAELGNRAGILGAVALLM